MKSSFIILCCFITGILLAYYRYVPDIFLTYDYSNYILPVMMFFVGIGIGGDIKSLYVPIKKYKLKIILIPLATISVQSSLQHLSLRYSILQQKKQLPSGLVLVITVYLLYS